MVASLDLQYWRIVFKILFYSIFVRNVNLLLSALVARFLLFVICYMEGVLIFFSMDINFSLYTSRLIFVSFII